VWFSSVGGLGVVLAQLVVLVWFGSVGGLGVV